MNLANILKMDKEMVSSYLSKIEDMEISDVNELELEELQGLLYSFVASYDVDNSKIDNLFFNIETYLYIVFELCVIFNQSFDLIIMLLGSNNDLLSFELINQLIDLIEKNSSSPLIKILNSTEALSSNFHDNYCRIIRYDKKSIVVISSIKKNEDCYSLILSKLYNSKYCFDSGFNILQKLPFGLYNYSFTFNKVIESKENCDNSNNLKVGCYTNEIKGRIFMTSPIYDYVLSLDKIFDRLYWGWEGNWTDSLESALLELLVSVNDELVQLVRSWKSMMSMMSGGSEDMEQMLDIILKDIQCALCDHSNLSIGRLHQTLVQFVELGSVGGLMSIPIQFVNAINNFLIAKYASSPQEPLLTELNSLMKAVNYYNEFLISKGISDNFNINNFLSRFDNNNNIELTVENVKLIFNLKPNPLEMIFNQSVEHWSDVKISYLPTILLEHVENKEMLDKVVQQQSETLLLEVMNIGSLLGYSINNNDISLSAAIITSLLDAGLCYVTSESGKLMATLPSLRSVLKLNDNTISVDNSKYNDNNDTIISSKTNSNNNINDNSGYNNNLSINLPIQLSKRVKDMSRIFRNKVKKNLQFRINSDIDLAISKLREHHGIECWVGPELERVWKLQALTNPPQLMIFELYYGDELIAADFGHPTNNGKTVYIATRFYSKSTDAKSIQPGFLLALVELEYLRKNGCYLWDLGSINLCPLMRYKLDLTGEPLEREEALFEIQSAKVMPIPFLMQNIKIGVIIDNISLNDILGYSNSERN